MLMPLLTRPAAKRFTTRRGSEDLHTTARSSRWLRLCPGSELTGREPNQRRPGSNRGMAIALRIGTRLAPGAVFLVFGADEFVNHARNVRSFALYGLPDPSAFSYAIGSLEILGALALLSGTLLLPAAVALAGDMVGAIVVSGIALGELVSLTLAPAMLAAMLVLIARELSGRATSATAGAGLPTELGLQQDGPRDGGPSAVATRVSRSPER